MSEQKYFWLAINGPSCAMSSFPFTKDVYVRPTPTQLIGLPTQDEARQWQETILTAPIAEVEAFFERQKSRADIVVINPRSPEPPTRGPTLWSSDPEGVEAVLAELEVRP